MRQARLSDLATAVRCAKMPRMANGNGSWRAAGMLGGIVALVVAIGGAVAAHVGATRDIEQNARDVSALRAEASADRAEWRATAKEIQAAIRRIELDIASLARKESP